MLTKKRNIRLSLQNIYIYTSNNCQYLDIPSNIIKHRTFESLHPYNISYPYDNQIQSTNQNTGGIGSFIKLGGIEKIFYKEAAHLLRVW